MVQHVRLQSDVREASVLYQYGDKRARNRLVERRAPASAALKGEPLNDTVRSELLQELQQGLALCEASPPTHVYPNASNARYQPQCHECVRRCDLQLAEGAHEARADGAGNSEVLYGQ
jgi:hypothetical protein